MTLPDPKPEYRMDLADISFRLYGQTKKKPSQSRLYLQKAINHYQALADQDPPNSDACHKLVAIYEDKSSEIYNPDLLVKYCRLSKDINDQLLLARCLYKGHGTQQNIPEARRILEDLKAQGNSQVDLLVLTYPECYTLEENVQNVKNCFQSPDLCQQLAEKNLYEACRQALLKWSLTLYFQSKDPDKKSEYLSNARNILQERQNDQRFRKIYTLIESNPTFQNIESALRQLPIFESTEWSSLKEYFLAIKNRTINEKIPSLMHLITLIDKGFSREFIHLISEPDYIYFIQHFPLLVGEDVSPAVKLLSQLPVNPEEPPEKELIQKLIKNLSSMDINDDIFLDVYSLLSRVGMPDDEDIVLNVLSMLKTMIDQYQPSPKIMCLVFYSLTFLHLKHEKARPRILPFVNRVLKKIEDSRGLMNYYDVEQLKTSCVYFLCVFKCQRKPLDESSSKIQKICGQLFGDIATKVKEDSDLKSNNTHVKSSSAQIRMGQELSRYFVQIQQEAIHYSKVKKQPFSRVTDFFIHGKVPVEYDGCHHFLLCRDGQVLNSPKTALRNFLLQNQFGLSPIIQLGELCPDFPARWLAKYSLEWSRQCFIFLTIAFKDYCELPIINFYVYLSWEQQTAEEWRKGSAVAGYLSHHDLWHRPSQIQKFFNQSREEFYYQLASKDGFVKTEAKTAESPRLKNLIFTPIPIDNRLLTPDENFENLTY